MQSSLPTVVLSALLLVLIFTRATSTADPPDKTDDDSDVEKANDNSTEEPKCDPKAKPCQPGLLLPRWEPIDDISLGDKVARAIVYFVALGYLFLGVSIVADRFMAAIEVITSKEKKLKIEKADGTIQEVNVKVWNETVSNLTLMALGSSAPEILLSVIEICGNSFKAGALGPGTIVGSAAFNLFVILGICVFVIPDDEVRRIKHLRVFVITASWSVFAYVWLYLILAAITPNVVDVAEAVLTLVFFPLTVITAYIADRRLMPKFISKRYRQGPSKGVVTAYEGDVEMHDGNHVNPDGTEIAFKPSDERQELVEFERHREEYIKILRELRSKNPNMDMSQLESVATEEAMNKGPKSRAFYRVQATRKLVGSGQVLKKSKIQEKTAQVDEEDVKKVPVIDDGIIRVSFDPGHYTVMENVGSFQVTVVRSGGNPSLTVSVRYQTDDGSASAGTDYVYAEGLLIFEAGVTEQTFNVEVLDDDVFEEDEHFYIRLSDMQVKDRNGRLMNNSDPVLAKLEMPFTATVMILDDDHGGIFHFDEEASQIPESCGVAGLKVVRSSGARGQVILPYKTFGGTAKPGKSYIHSEGLLKFDNDQPEDYIKINIIDDEQYEKSEIFYIQLFEPYVDERFKPDLSGLSEEDRQIAEMGLPKLGEITKIAVTIVESPEFKMTVDKLLKKANVSLVIGTSSWREQFSDALSVSAGDEEDGEEDKVPSCSDYIMHYLTLIWKLLFAFIPPTDIWDGWACFVVSICFIGLLTAVIGDLASHFGCTVGLKDTVTAISFVALGTSIPDTFASKTAATGDQYADSSIGNVTGSNAVNVFLGIGLAWTIAAVYWASKGMKFEVKAGNLAFSVTLYCTMALVCIAILMIRRKPSVGGELGGPKRYKIPTSILLFLLWVTYVLLSSLQSYCVIPGF